MATLRVSSEYLLKRLFPGVGGPVLLDGARYEDGTVFLEIQGHGIPETGNVTCVVTHASEAYSFVESPES